MNWKEYIDEVYLINLEKRIDRYVDFVQMAEPYDFKFTRVNAIERPNEGALGLRDTMAKLFTEALDKGCQNILVFEDDALIIEPSFNSVMDDIIYQLPSDYRMILLGCQPSRGFTGFYSHNLLPVEGAFSTHAVMYSRKVMEEIMSRYFDAPIDNWFVSAIQPMGGVYATEPFLVTQRPSFSDIGMADINWGVFLETRHQQKMMELQEKGKYNRPPKPFR